MSLTGLFYSILGSKDEQLDKERQEYLVNRLKYEECKYAISSFEGELADLQQQIVQLGDLETQYTTILERKERLISDATDENAGRLIQFSKRLANVQADIRELQEAITVGNNVLDSLDELIASLKSAGNWGA